MSAMQASESTRHLAFFLTGHGFGHGVRESASMNALPAGIHISIFTSLPKSFFQEELQRPFNYEHCEIDCGCIQPDTLRVDVAATLARYAEIDSQRDNLIAFWSQRLHTLKVDLVIGDIPPLAFPIAKAAGLKAIAICNFAWTDIYRSYLAHYPEYSEMLDRMRGDYAIASQHLQLSPYHGIPFCDQTQDMGLLARPGLTRRSELASIYGLDESKHWCLIYIGSYGLQGIAWQRLAEHSGWEFFGLYELPGAEPYRRIQKNPGLNYADLTASADLVLGKLGYGLVGECLAHGTPVAFPGRSDFSEFEVLKQVLLEAGLGHEIELNTLLAGEFTTALKWATQTVAKPIPAEALGNLVKALGF